MRAGQTELHVQDLGAGIFRGRGNIFRYTFNHYHCHVCTKSWGGVQTVVQQRVTKTMRHGILHFHALNVGFIDTVASSRPVIAGLTCCLGLKWLQYIKSPPSYSPDLCSC